MANGRVCTGFSMPWVASYANSGTTITYSGGIPLARGVNVSVSIETADDNNFYADNVLAETETGVFQSGSVSLEVDGLKSAAKELISGVRNTESVTVTATTSTASFDVYDDDTVAPYVGVGFVVRYMEGGVTTYDAVILPKVRFSPEGLDAATQEDEIDWQTTTLEGTILRDDSAKHAWKKIANGFTSETAAYEAIKAVLLAS